MGENGVKEKIGFVFEILFIKMKSIFLILVLGIVSLSCFSQEEVFQLKGHLKNDSLSLSNIKITNKTLKIHTLSNKSGGFKIPVRLGDTLVLAAVHIKKDSIRVTNEAAKNKTIELNIKAKVNELDEVVLNRILSESALDFSAALKPTLKLDEESRKRREIYNLTKTIDTTQQNTGVNIIGGFAFILKLFKKKNKKPSKSKRKIMWQRFKSEFTTEFGNSFFTDDLKIPELMIDNFWEFCKTHQKSDIGLAYSRNEKLIVLDFFVKQSEQYKELYLKKD